MWLLWDVQDRTALTYYDLGDLGPPSLVFELSAFIMGAMFQQV